MPEHINGKSGGNYEPQGITSYMAMTYSIQYS